MIDLGGKRRARLAVLLKRLTDEEAAAGPADLTTSTGGGRGGAEWAPPLAPVPKPASNPLEVGTTFRAMRCCSRERIGLPSSEYRKDVSEAGPAGAPQPYWGRLG